MYKKIKKIIVILCIFVILYNNIGYAATESEYQNAVASYCWNFYKNTGKDTRYDYGTAGLGVNEGHGENYAREQAYIGNRLSGVGHDWNGYETGEVKAPDTAYFFDCVGWVSFALHNSVKVGNDTFTYFGTPSSCSEVVGTGYQKMAYSSGDSKPGDILCTSGHVMLFVGDINNSGRDCIIHCNGYGTEGRT